jgi:hypothetical protein
MAHLARALRSNASVTSLALRKWPQMTASAIQCLCDYILDNGMIRRLDLGSNHIAGPGGTALAETLAAGAPFETLILDRCRIGDEGACALVAAMEQCAQNAMGLAAEAVAAGTAFAYPRAASLCLLRYLDLRHNDIRDAGVSALTRVVATEPEPADGGSSVGRARLSSLLLEGNALQAGSPGTTAMGNLLMAGVSKRATAVAVGEAPIPGPPGGSGGMGGMGGRTSPQGAQGLSPQGAQTRANAGAGALSSSSSIISVHSSFVDARRQFSDSETDAAQDSAQYRPSAAQHERPAVSVADDQDSEGALPPLMPATRIDLSPYIVDRIMHIAIQ